MKSFLTLYDLILTPIYLILISIGIFWFKHRFLKDKVLRKHFLPAIYLKLFGAVALGLIYQFYYSGGDTSMYYKCILEVCGHFYTNPGLVIKFIIDPEKSPLFNNASLLLYRIAEDPSSLVLVRIGVILSIISFNTYSIIALFMGIITFIGVWKLFCFLYRTYPSLEKGLAISLFYMPSVFFWGSGLMKDGLTLSALCLAFYSLASFLTFRKKTYYLISFFFCLYIMFSIKIYIVLCFFPAIIIWVFSTFNYKIRNELLRKTAAPIMLVLAVSIGFMITDKLSRSSEKYNFETLLATAKITSSYIGRVSILSDGSYYSLGDYEPTLAGIIPKIPAAIWVTLFRPYLWEVRNVPMLLTALESSFFLYLTLAMLYKAKVYRIFKVIRYDPFVQFSILFSLMFAFSVGISSYNFGALVRYKIPMMPFYLAAVYIIKSKFDLQKKKLPVSPFLKHKNLIVEEVRSAH